MFSVLRCGAFVVLISTLLGLCTANRNSQRALSPDRSHLSLSPDTSDLKRSLSPDTSDLKRSLSPDTSDLKRSLSPDRSHLKQNPNPDPSHVSLSHHPTGSVHPSSNPLASLLFRGLRTAESSHDSAVEKAQGKAEERAEGPASQGQRQKRDHLEEEEDGITSDKLTMKMHRDTLSLMSLVDTVTELDEKADELIGKPSEDGSSDATVGARMKALKERLEATRLHMKTLQGSHVKREQPEQQAVPRHAEDREPATVAENNKTAKDQAKQEDPLQQEVNQLQQQVRELQELMNALQQQTESLRSLQENRTSS